MATKKIYRWRSSITGKYVSSAYALQNPSTTVRHVVKPKPASDKPAPKAKSKSLFS